MSPFTLGIAQFAPILADVERNLEKVEAFVVQAIQAGADVLVFPELALTGYTLRDAVPTSAQRLDSPAMRKIAAMSADISIAIGFIEESDDYRYYNSGAYYEGGELLHVHRKVYLPTYGMFEEGRYMAPGDRVRAFQTRWGRFAMLCCEDLWHPSSAYIASQDGTHVLLGLASSPARGIQDEDQLYSSKAWQTLNLMYSHFFTQYVVFANRVGYEDGVGFWGGSEVVDPEGAVIARAPFYEEHFLTARVVPERIRRARLISPLLRDERLDVTLRELDRIQRRRVEGEG